MGSIPILLRIERKRIECKAKKFYNKYLDFPKIADTDGEKWNCGKR